MAFLDPHDAAGDRSSRLTTSTMVSDYFSHGETASTGLTTPSLGGFPLSPRHKGSFTSLTDIAESEQPLGLGPPPTETIYIDQNPIMPSYQPAAHVDPVYADDPPGVQRGLSVSDRASLYEASVCGGSTVSHVSRAASPMRLPPSPAVSRSASPMLPPVSPRRAASPMRLPPASRTGSPRSASPAGSPHMRLPPTAPLKRSSSPLALPPSPRPVSPPPQMLSAPTRRALPQAPCATIPQEATTPPRTRRVPVPASAPPMQASSPTRLARGSSARRMIEQWESGLPEAQNVTPPLNIRRDKAPYTSPRQLAQEPSSPSPRRLPQQYLDKKPLPIPMATPIPASRSMPWPPPNTARLPSGGTKPPPSNTKLPAGGLQMPSPLDNGREYGTPQSQRSQKTSLLEPASWSPLSRKRERNVSGAKSPRKSPLKQRSPFKEIVNVFTGLRKKDKGEKMATGWGTAAVGMHGDQPRQFLNLDEDASWFARPQHVGVLDRMGDEEMGTPPIEDISIDKALRSTAMLFLMPTPYESTQWGDWRAGWATLDQVALSITYMPTLTHGSFDSIPRSDTTAHPDVELNMKDCHEVRSLRAAECRGRHIPPVPEGYGSEVLELSFSHGFKRYVAVEGVAGRLGWVSAIWDVILASKQDGNLVLPPPSPSLASLQIGRGHDAPVQRFGDQWIAAGDIGAPPSLRDSPLGRSLPTTPEGNPWPTEAEAISGLPHSLQPGQIVPQASRLPPRGLFLANADEELPTVPAKRSVEERIKAWTAESSDDHCPPAPKEPGRFSDTSSKGASGSFGTANGRSFEGSFGTSSGTYVTGTTGATPLRESVVNLFNASDDQHSGPPRRSRTAAMEERIRAWQPLPEHTPPPQSTVSRAGSKSQASQLSFNDSDLNPSRSASQIRPRGTVVEDVVDLGAVNAGLRELPLVPERLPPPPAVQPDVSPAGPRWKASRPMGARSPVPETTPALPGAPVVPAEVEMPKPSALPTKLQASTPAATEKLPTCSPAVSDTSQTKSPIAATPRRMNTRMLAAAAVFEPSIAERSPASTFPRSPASTLPPSMAKRKPAPALLDTELQSPSVVSAKSPSVASKKSPPAKTTSRLRSPPKPKATEPGVGSPKSDLTPLLGLGLHMVGSPEFKASSGKSNLSVSQAKSIFDQPRAMDTPQKSVVSDTKSTPKAPLSTTSRQSVPTSNTALATEEAEISPAAKMRSLAPPSPCISSTLGPISDGNSSLLAHYTSPAILPHLEAHSAEHARLAQQLDNVHVSVASLGANLGVIEALMSSDKHALVTEHLESLGNDLRNVHAAVDSVPPTFGPRFDAITTDLRTIQIVLQETAAQVADLAVRSLPVEGEKAKEKDLPPMPTEVVTEVPEPQLPEINAKLDALAHLIQEVLARQADLAAAAAVGAGATVVTERDETMPGAAKETPRELPSQDAQAAPPPAPAANPEQLTEIHAMVQNLERERALQAQQTADIAQYLAQLNGWLEKFVQNSGGELENMSRHLENLALPGGGDSGQGARLDALVALMGEERERAQRQMGVAEHVVQMLEKQRSENEMLLRAVATDLSSEIRGERVRFIEAMQQATTMNMQIHVDEFKRALTNEVSSSMRELGTLREQKKALQHQIADLFSLLAKNGEEHRLNLPLSPTSPHAAPPTPGPGRVLPLPPH